MPARAWPESEPKWVKCPAIVQDRMHAHRAQQPVSTRWERNCASCHFVAISGHERCLLRAMGGADPQDFKDSLNLPSLKPQASSEMACSLKYTNLPAVSARDQLQIYFTLHATFVFDLH